MPATFERHVPLSPLTTFGVGGPARSFVCAETEADLIEAVDGCDEPLFILGGGSNLLVSDEGFEGRVVRVATRGVEVRRDGDLAHLTASAGEPWDALVERAVEDSLAGLECLSGIPGLVGATPIQNVGAYGQEVSDTIAQVRVWDRVARRVARLSPSDCAFGYRDSAFKREAQDRYLVLDVTFTLRVGGVSAPRYGELSRALDARASAPSLREIRNTVIALRRAKSMVLDPRDPDSRSAGSFFVNPVVTADEANEVEARARALGVMRDDEGMPRFAAEGGRVKLAAGWLIERAGVSKGTRLGGAAVSRRHSLALVNLDGATARDVVALAKVVQSTVRDRMGVTLTPEPVMVGFGVSDPLA